MAIFSIELLRESWSENQKNKFKEGSGQGKKKLSNLSLFLFFALVPTFSTNARRNACHARYFCGGGGGGGGLMSGDVQAAGYGIHAYHSLLDCSFEAWELVYPKQAQYRLIC